MDEMRAAELRLARACSERRAGVLRAAFLIAYDEGPAGRGLEITWGGTPRGSERWSSAMRLIFDAATGEVLSTRISENVGDERHAGEYTYLRAEPTRSIPWA